MGWTGVPTYGQKITNSFIRKNIEDTWKDNLGRTHSIEVSSIKASNAWGYHSIDGKPDSIYSILISRRKDWLYFKDISEEMGPCQYDCPEYILKKVPDPKSGYSTEWRKKMSDISKKRKERSLALKSLEVGDFIKFHDNNGEYKVAQINRSSFIVIGKYDGTVYKVSKSRFKEKVE